MPQLPADHPAQRFAALPARELVALAQGASGDRTGARSQAIFTALYYRYYPYLSRVVSNALGFIYDRDAIQEIVNDALAAFFRASGKFQLGLAGDEAGCERLVRSYLARLARWKASHARSFQKSFGADVLDLEELDARLNQLARFGAPAAAEAAGDPAGDPRAERVARWLDALRAVERDVVQTYFFDDHAGRKSTRLPDGVARRLAEKHGVTTSNIRHLKRKLQQQLRANFRAP